MEIKLNIAKKHLYILMAFVLAVAGIALVIGYGTTTPDTFGHSAGEMMVTVGGVAKTLQSAIDDGSLGGGSTSDILDTDLVWFGNMGLFLKDGAITGEANCIYYIMPNQFAYMSGQAKKENGKIYTKAWGQGRFNSCDSGWVEGYTASCSSGDAESEYKTTLYGVEFNIYSEWVIKVSDIESFDAGAYQDIYGSGWTNMIYCEDAKWQ